MTARTSSALICTTSLGSGLPPAAAISPPALCTRMSMGPSSALAVATVRSMSSDAREVAEDLDGAHAMRLGDGAGDISQRLACRRTRTGPCSRMPCTAMWQPSAASRSAKARPSPRPAPVTSATWPSSSAGRACESPLRGARGDQSCANDNPTARLCARHIGPTIVRSAASGISGISNTTLAPSTIGLSRLSVMATAGTPRATSSGNSRAVSGL